MIKVYACVDCPFCDSSNYCNLKHKRVDFEREYPWWCPLRKRDVTVTLVQPKVLPPETAKEIEENIVRGLDDNG